MAGESVSYSVVLLTAQYSISGDLSLHDQRLSDFLNDRRETVINLHNVRVARLLDPGKILQQDAEAAIPKEWIVVAFEPPQKAIPPAKRFFGYVKKQTHEVFVVLDGMEVRGTLHTAGPLELQRFVATSSERFLPITKAVVRLYANDRYVIEQETIMMNAHLIRYIARLGG